MKKITKGIIATTLALSAVPLVATAASATATVRYGQIQTFACQFGACDIYLKDGTGPVTHSRVGYYAPVSRCANWGVPEGYPAAGLHVLATLEVRGARMGIRDLSGSDPGLVVCTNQP